MIGIYKIINPKGKIYIGQSTNIGRRRKNYSRLQDCKNQPKLYNSLIKYSFSQHIFEVIEQCTVEQLNERERYWQDYYNVLSENGLNCRLTKTEDKSGHCSKETASKIATTRIAYNKTRQGQETLIKQSENRKLFESTQKGVETRAKIVANLLIFNKTEKGVSKIKNQAAKLKAFYKTEEGSRSRAKQVNKTNYTAIAEKNWKPIKQYSKDEIFIREWNSGKEASVSLKISRGDISACLKGRYKSAGGFVWKYRDQ